MRVSPATFICRPSSSSVWHLNPCSRSSFSKSHPCVEPPFSRNCDILWSMKFMLFVFCSFLHPCIYSRLHLHELMEILAELCEVVPHRLYIIVDAVERESRQCDYQKATNADYQYQGIVSAYTTVTGYRALYCCRQVHRYVF